MKITKWAKPKKQSCYLGNHSWKVTRLFKLSKKLKVLEIPLDHLNIYHNYKSLSLRDMVMHFQAVERADLSYPIILDEDGELMDGRHRIMKALLRGHKTIKAVRFEVNPSPCHINKENSSE